MTALISQDITANTRKISSRPQNTRLFQERFVDPRSEGQKTPFQPSIHDDASTSRGPRPKNPFQASNDDASISQATSPKSPFQSSTHDDASIPQAPRLKNPFQPSNDSNDDASISQGPRLKNPFHPSNDDASISQAASPKSPSQLSTHEDTSISQATSPKNTTQPLIRARGRRSRRRRRRTCGRRHKCACGLCPNQLVCSSCGRQRTCIVCRPWPHGPIPVKFDSLAVIMDLIDARAAVIMPDCDGDLVMRGV